jgi:hypothetical protein
MGTDIFLKWDGMTEQESNAQLAASKSFRLNAGRLGYLRASTGMKRENAFLRLIFPLEYWYNSTGEPVPFNFLLGQSALSRGARAYLQSARDGTSPNFKDYTLVAVSTNEEIKMTTNQSVEGVGLQKVVAGDEDLVLEAAKEWLEEVAEFFNIGMEKQDAGLHPKILVSW